MPRVPASAHQAGPPASAEGGGVARALGRVAIAFRLIGAVWLVTIAAVRGAVGELTEPWVVAGTVVLVLVWTVVTLIVAGWGDEEGRRRAGSIVWLVADTAVACWTVLGPALLGEPVAFAGAYPFTAVVLAAWARGRRTVVVVAAALAVAAVARTAVLGAISLAQGVQDVLFYLVGATVLGWAVRSLEQAEAGRLAAEAALTRAEERAATAAHLHDSVLQTLALIQRRAGEAGEVRALARRQERELRAWLYGTGAAVPASSLAAAVQEIAGEVEASYGVAVEVVVTGDAESVAVDDRSAAAALVAATREALVNAAKHAGVDEASVYLEVGAAQLAAYVRDRGNGFEVQAVPDDRRGLRDSITDRIERHGGSARVRSSPGTGTEIALTVPRSG